MTTIGLFLLLIRRALEFWSLNAFIYDMRMAEILGYLDIFIPIFLSFSLLFIYKISRMVSLLEVLKFKSEQKILYTIIHTEEKEREILAKGIHDNLGPMLSTIKLSLSAIEPHVNESGLTILKNNQDTIDKAITHIRSISNRISLHVLKKFGLEKAFNSFLKKLDIPESLTINFICSLNKQRIKNYNVEIVLFRFLIETTEEALKFGGKHKISINLFEINNMLFLNYKHSSALFKPEYLLKHSSSDYIPNMIIRIKSLKGDISIQRSESKGTHISVKIHLKNNDNKKLN
ncbi:MAG: sensor histidine kinase [Bacteroidales bacterium]